MSVSASAIKVDRRDAEQAEASFDWSTGVVRGREDLDVLASRWKSLAKRCSGASVYQSLGWAQAVFEFEAARGNKDFDPVIATLEDGRRLVAVLPMERIRTGARRVLVPLGHAYAQYSDVLLNPGTDPHKALKPLLRAALAAAPSESVGFFKVRDGSALAQGLPHSRAITGEEQGAPYVALSDFPDFASYFQTIRTKTRKNMRNARNRLEREGPVAHAVVSDPAAQVALIERTMSGRAERLRDQGLTSRAFADQGFFEFCKSLVGRKDLEVMAFSLTHDGKPIAEQWGFVHAGRYYAYVASRDFSNSEESPGKLHLQEILHACQERDLAGCDLGVPAMPYKMTWATQNVLVRDYALPVTPRGWLMIQLWDVMLRPTLKKIMLRLPSKLRVKAMKLAGRGQ